MEENATIHIEKTNKSLQVTMLAKNVALCCPSRRDKERKVIHEQLPKVWVSWPLWRDMVYIRSPAQVIPLYYKGLVKTNYIYSKAKMTVVELVLTRPAIFVICNH